MQRIQHTWIEDVTALGGEVAEEHLALAAGGRLNLRVPRPRTVKQYITNDRVQFDEQYDW